VTTPTARALRHWRGMPKRVLDLTVGMSLTALTLPLVLVLLVVSGVIMRSTPLFRQLRVGRHQKLFWFVKIRSLHPTVSPSASKYELLHHHSNRFGRFIRTTHLDEMPQFWLVLTGRMSLVGPRPEMPHLDEEFKSQQRQARRPFRPGITGLWQVSEDSHRLMLETPEYDVFYAQHHCMRLDFWILWRTVVMHASGNFITLDSVPQWAMTHRALADCSRKEGVV
jgi:lipopolysaccharide/colanic/teichoic acid biosynthesis glycosyltransferase